MYLVRLVYASEVVRPVGDGDLEQILNSAREKNGEDGITGMLCFHRKYFLQCLEGSRMKVNEAYQRILKDKRHTNIVILDYQEIVHREFEAWTMGYMPESQLTTDINMRYSGNTEFTPFEMLGESCHLMMVELKDTVPTI